MNPDRSKKIVARFYVSSSGNLPVREWIVSLVPQDKRTVGKDIQKIEFGWPIGMPYCRSLGRGLWEVRSNISSGRIARILFCITGRDMVLLHGFVKKSQKTPQQEIELAMRRWKELD